MMMYFRSRCKTVPPGVIALSATTSSRSSKVVELRRSPDRHQYPKPVILFPAAQPPHWIYRARRIYRWFAHPLDSTLTLLMATIVVGWAVSMGLILLYMALRGTR
jgi:hypothetical protein